MKLRRFANRILAVHLLTVAFACGATTFDLNENDFRLISDSGESTALSYFSDMEAILILAWPRACWNRNEVLNWYSRLEERLDRSKVAVLWLESGLPQDRAAVRRLIGGRFAAPVLMDFSQSVSRGFQFKNGGDYLLLRPKPWSVIASGSWSTGHLEGELSPWLAKKVKPSVIENARIRLAQWSTSHIASCPLPYEDREHLTLDRDMATRFYNTCGECHAKAPLLDYFATDQAVAGWSAMNRNVLRNYRMPPFGYDYDGETSNCTRVLRYKLNEEDLRVLLNWFDLGSPRLSRAEDYTARIREQRKTTQEKMPAPDIVWKTPRVHHIPAEGLPYFENVQLAGPITKDLEVTAYNLDNNIAVAPHVALWALPHPLGNGDLVKTGNHYRLRAISEDLDKVGAVYIGGFTLRNGLIRVWPGAARVIRKGWYVVVSIHYFPTGRPESNRVSIGLYLNRSPNPLAEVHYVRFPIKEFQIPPRERNFRLQYDFPVSEDITIMNLFGHAHQRAVLERFELKLPTGETRVLCNVPYRHSTQDALGLWEPIFAPKGSIVKLTLVYDNSAQNPANPDPNANVMGGFEMDSPEMGYGSMSYLKGRPKL
jgi:hypothetical protein